MPRTSPKQARELAAKALQRMTLEGVDADAIARHRGLEVALDEILEMIPVVEMHGSPETLTLARDLLDSIAGDFRQLRDDAIVDARNARAAALAESEA